VARYFSRAGPCAVAAYLRLPPSPLGDFASRGPYLTRTTLLAPRAVVKGVE